MTTKENQQIDPLIKIPDGIPIIVKVLLFMISLVLFFTTIANLLPQVEGQAPKEIKMDLGALTMDNYISMGEELFKGKGTCTLCHNNLGRAPDLLALDMEAIAAERIKDPQYKGLAKDSLNYFKESMVSPSEYVVPGYGKPGEPSPMPAINKAPIELSDIEMGAVIAFLQAKDGGQATVELPKVTPVIEQKATTKKADPSSPAATAEKVLSKFGCTACHAVLDSPSTIGPELKTVGARSSREEIRQSIINPTAVIATGFPPIMPANFADQMIVKELQLVVEFLANSKANTK